jgi:peptide/nickel transport system ATP-binding protein
VVRLVADEVYVLQHGCVVEHGEPEAIFGTPKEEYTRRLVAAIPGRRAAVR